MPMDVRSADLFMYPWDFADDDPDRVLDLVRGLGVTRLVLASVYHAGFFFHPHNPRRKVHHLEDGVAYFHPAVSHYASTPLKPRIAGLCAQVDWFGRICEKARAAGLEVCAWTVCLHNTPLGLAHPAATIQNAFGDSHPHALSPAHPDARAYVRGLVADLAEHYPLHSILLEAANYRRRAHGGTWVSGHHHERMGVHLRDLEDRLLDVSFNPADMRAGEAAGVDVAALRGAIVAHLTRYLESAPEVPADLASTIEQFRAAHPALAAYEACFPRAEASLLRELREQAQRRGVKLAGSGESADIVLAGAYGESTERVGAITRAARAALRPGQELLLTLRLGFTSPGQGDPIASQELMTQRVRAAADAGADAIGFYNYAEAPRRCVGWIGPALRAIGFRGTLER